MDDTPAPWPLLTTPPQPIPPSGTAVGRGARRLFVYGAFFVMGIALGFVLLEAGIEMDSSLPVAGLLLCLLVAIYLCTLTHEVGHALATRLVNWQLLTIAVGPVALRRTPHGARLERNPLSRAWGGFVYAIPRDDRHLRRRRAVVVAGGPLASLLLALLATAVWQATTGSGLWPTLLFQTGLMSFTIAVLTLVPYRSGGLTSDGGQLLQLLRGGPRVEQRMAAHLILTALVGGVRPRNLDDRLMARALATDNPAEAVGAHYLAYWRDLDRGDLAGATAHLDAALAQRAVASPAAQAGYAAEAAYLTARHDPTPDAPATAEAWLKLAAPIGSVDSNYRRAQAAVHLANGRANEARQAADDALRLLDHALDIGGAEAEREWLATLRDAALAGGRA